MCFVDQDQIELAKLMRPLIDALDASHDDVVVGVAAAKAGRVDAIAQLWTDDS